MEEIKSIRISELKDFKNHPFHVQQDMELCALMKSIKVVIKERDAWTDLANFIGEMVAKYAEAMELDQLPNPDCYLRMKRIKQLYKDYIKQKILRNSEVLSFLLKEMLRHAKIAV